MLIVNKLFGSHHFHESVKNIRNYARRTPFDKAIDSLSSDLPPMFKKEESEVIIEHTDVAIIGGGILGSSIAFWLKTRAGRGLSVAVIEKDPTYKNSSRNLSLSTLQQHFSLPENILLSQYSADFFRNIKKHFNNSVDIKYCPNGYLVLASEKYAEKLEENVKVQRELGVQNELLTPAAIKKLYPWINTDDIKLGCVATEGEGILNSFALLKGFVEKSQEMGAIYINAEVTGFSLEHQRDVMMEGVPAGTYHRLNTIKYRKPNNEEYELKFAICVLAAGWESTEIAEQAGIGIKDRLLSVPLPVKKRELNIYSVNKNNAKIGLNVPFVMDTSGVWLRKQGFHNELLCGQSPLPNSDDRNKPLEYFDQFIKEPLHNRIPQLHNSEVKHVGVETYDYNAFDENGIIGPHPYYNNLQVATGFGILGYQHAPGVGRAIAELIIDSRFTTIDLTRMCFDRIMTDQPIIEENVY